jgi:predicted DNA-binding WGR domain protein
MDCILWNQDGTSDKLWGFTERNGQTFTFWGRRGKALQYKFVEQAEAERLKNAKMKKGYEPSSFDAIENETTGFREEFETNLLPYTW